MAVRQQKKTILINFSLIMQYNVEATNTNKHRSLIYSILV